ncbi:MAG: hypothetical protein IJX78_06560 [Bacilli bacterium]|nr:hypothetical protein [Bacilli bacterium]
MKVLFKHELKNHYIEIGILSAANIILCTLIGLCSLFLDDSSWVSNIIVSTLMIAFVGVMIALAVVLVVSVVKSFNTKLFTNEGYLTFVLPVSIDKMLIVKYLVNLLWVVIVSLSYIIGILIITLMVIGTEDAYTFEIFKGIGEAILNSPIHISLYILQALAVVLLCFSSLFLTLAILNCGKIKKAKFILGLLIYSALNNVINFVSTIASYFSFAVVETGSGLKVKFISLFDIFDGGDYYVSQVFNFNSFIVSVIAIVGLYLFARFIIKRKLELE